ncbi:MAG: zinc metalloprotease HtpX [Patescibacteria group bacterium]
MTLYSHQDSNIRKTWFLMFSFFVLVAVVSWFISEIYGTPEILFVAVFIAVFINFISYWYSDKIVLSIAGAKSATRAEYFDLWNAVENLSITAGLPIPKIYVIPDSVPNAFATGRDPKHAVVAVSVGLLEILNKNELEGVIAHELSHIGNRDILISTVVVVLAGFIAILSDFFLRFGFRGGRDNEKGGGALAILGLIMIILAPIAATIIKLAVSRKREFLADSTGALLTRYPEGLASALEKISAHSGKMNRASHATAHLYIANPFGGKKVASFLDKMFSTHPPIEERINILRKNA